MAGPGPAAQLLQPGDRVRQVGLENDARPGPLVALLAQDLTKHGQGQIEVPVLLHVQVDELLRPVAVGQVVQPAQAGGDPVNLGVEGEHVELRADRGDLHRDVVDRRLGEDRLDPAQAGFGFVLPEDRFAEHVDVHPDALAPAAGDVPGQPAGRGRQYDAGHLAPDPLADGRDDRLGQPRGQPGAGLEGEAIQAAQGLGPDAGCLHQVPEHGGGPGRIADAQYLVGQGQDQLAAGRIGQDAGHAGGLGSLPPAPPGLGVAEEGGGQVLGRGGETGVIVAGSGPGSGGTGSFLYCRPARPRHRRADPLGVGDGGPVGHSPTPATGPRARRMAGGIGCLPEPSVATTT